MYKWNSLMDTHTHTLTKTKASSAEVMKEDVPCFMMVKQTAWEKGIQPSRPMFQQDHQVIHNQVAGTPEWPTLVSHVISSFIGHSPNDMLCPPAILKKWW